MTVILNRIEKGEPEAAKELLPLVYEELRRLAASRMAQEKAAQTLQPTALVHEAWLRLVGGNEDSKWNGRGHFFGAAAEAMRRILIDRARSKGREKRGGQRERVDIQHVTLAIQDTDETVLAVHEALDKLAALDPLKARIVNLRYFVGMNHQEIASALDLSEPTVRRHWAFARSWLYSELKSSP